MEIRSNEYTVRKTLFFLTVSETGERGGSCPSIFGVNNHIIETGTCGYLINGVIYPMTNLLLLVGIYVSGIIILLGAPNLKSI